jgi:hypothetical protein
MWDMCGYMEQGIDGFLGFGFEVGDVEVIGGPYEVVRVDGGDSFEWCSFVFGADGPYEVADVGRLGEPSDPFAAGFAVFAYVWACFSLFCGSA